MKVSKRAAVAAAIVAAAGVTIPTFAANTGTTKTSSATETRDCGNGRSVALTGPQTLWPPNHKMVNESATATGTKSDTDTTMMVAPQVQDVHGGDGGPTHDPDFSYPTGSPTATNMSGNTATEPFQLRAERSGKGDGRTYTVDWTATWNGGTDSCTSTDGSHAPFTITVPHDQRKQ